MTKFTIVYGSSVIQLPSALIENDWSRPQSDKYYIRFSIYIGTDWVRLNFILKIECIEY